ncbi:hypothetical protein PTKIN_Ptkin02bG0021400 [Pterospermum kingtungense]
MSCYRLSILILLLLLQPSSPRNHQHDSKFPSCDSFSNTHQRSSCFQLQRIHNFRPFSPSFPQPPPSPELNEIDPRYGVEKRLVPSGPNPLHN